MERIVHFCFLFCGLVVLVMGLLLRDGLSQDQALSVRQHEISGVFEAAHRIRDNYIHAEVLAREFAASGNPAVFIEKTERLKKIKADFAVLEGKFQDNPAQLQRLHELASAFAKIEPMLNAASSTQHEGHDVAMQLRGEFFNVHSELRHLALNKLVTAIQVSQGDIRARLVTLSWLVAIGLLFLIALYLYALRKIRVYRQLETQQKQSDELLRLTVDSVSGMIVYIDRNGHYKFCNKAYARYVGYGVDAIVGTTLDQVLEKELYKQVRPYLERALSGQVVEAEYSLFVRGQKFEFRNYLVPHRDQNGEVLGFFGELSDITGFKRKETLLLETTSFQKAILDSARISIITTDREGIIETFNVGAEKKLGYRADELIGHATPICLHDEQECRVRADALSIELAEPITPDFELLAAKPSRGLEDEQEWTYIRKDGSRFPVFLSITALRTEHGEVIGYLVVAIDITQQKQTESQLIQARKDAEAAARAKSAFLATMSHEIRTPMNGVLGMAEVLTRTEMSSRQLELVQTIRESSNVLLTLIDDILDFSKIEAGRLKLEYTPLCVRGVAEGICTSLRPVATNKNVDLRCFVSPDVPDSVWADDVRLRQILYNLLGNAIKFSGTQGAQRGQVQLDVDVAQTSPLKISFRVTDNGIGIAPEAIDGLFSAFTQAESSTTRRFGGTGLGLAICKRIVELWHGDIRVKSTLGNGATFTVTLPFKQAPAYAGPRADQPGNDDTAFDSPQSVGASPARPVTVDSPLSIATAQAQGRLILVAEDNELNQKVILHQLRELGYVAEIASTGVEALRMWRTGRYALLLTDVHMPELDGCGLAIAIRAEESGTSRKPILALTANALRGASGQALNCGMDDYLTKPIRLDVLKRRLEKWMPQSDVVLRSVSDPDPAVSGAATQDRTDKSGLVASPCAIVITEAARVVDNPVATGPDAVDINILRDLIGGDEATLYELLADFQMMAQNEVKALRQASDTADVAGIIAIAHKLKSSSRAIGALELGDACADLEDAGKADDAEVTRHCMQRFDVAFAAVDAALKGVLDKGA